MPRGRGRPGAAAPRREPRAGPAPKPLKLLRGLLGATRALCAVPRREAMEEVVGCCSSARGAAGAARGCLEAETSGFCLTLSVAFGSFIQAAGGRRDPPRPVSRTDSDGGGERSAVLGGLSAWGRRLPGPHRALFGAGVELPLGSLDFSEPGLQRCLLSVVFGLLFSLHNPPFFFYSECFSLFCSHQRE